MGADFIAGAFHVPQDPIGAIAQFLAGLGEPDAPVDPGEQRDAELVFQPLDLACQGRLRDPQVRRRTCDAAKLGDADEVVQATQFHSPKLPQTPHPMPERYGADRNSAFVASQGAG